MATPLQWLYDIELSGILKILNGAGYLDMDNNEIRNSVAQNLITTSIGNITSPMAGRFLYNSTTNKFGYYNGTAWKYPDMEVSVYDTDGDGRVNLAVESDTLDGQHGSYYLDRSHHTGTQLAATISDFNTAVRLNRLDQMTAPTADVNMNVHKITNLDDCVYDTDAANKRYVDTKVTGLSWKTSCKVATTGNISLSGAQTIDGTSVAAGDRVLVKNQTTTSANGIYTVASGAWTRSTDMDAWAKVPNAACFIEKGSTNAETCWVCSSDQGGTLNTTAIAWVQFGGMTTYTAGNGLSLTGNQFDINVDDQSIQIVSDTLQAKLDAAGAITKTNSGLKINVDGTAIVVTGNQVTIGSAYKNKKVTGAITGDGSTTVFSITHNLGSKDFLVNCYDGSNGCECYPLLERYDVNTLKVSFKVAPTSGKTYNVVMI